MPSTKTMLIHPHPAYPALGGTDAERHSAYRALAMENLSQDHLEAIRAQLYRQHALGSDRFRIAIKKQLCRNAGPAKNGHPCDATQGKTPESAL
jgi:putative transposase